MNTLATTLNPPTYGTLQEPQSDWDWIPHRVISGKTGSGKTNFALNEMMDVVYQGTHWLTFVAPHEKAAVDFVAELYAQFGEYILSRLVIEPLGDTDSVIMRQIIQKSDSTDYWQRKQENDAFCEAMISLMAARRKMTDFFERPSLEDVSTLAIQLYQNQDVWWPEYLLPQALHPKNPISKFALDHCTDLEIRERLSEKINVSPSVAETSTKPVARMLELLIGALKARTCQPQIWDKKEFHNNAGIFIIVANGCSIDALRTYTFSEFQQCVSWMKSGQIGPGVFVVDEVANYSLAGMFEARAFNTTRGSGLSIWHIVQSPDYHNDDVTEAILDNSDHYVFQQGSSKSAKYFAEDLLPVLDEYKVHHTTKKRIDRDPILERRKGKTITKRDDGGKTESETIGEHYVPDFEYEDENVYQSGNEQVLWLAQKLQKQPRGSYFYKTSSAAGQARAELFHDSWAFPGLKEAKYLECLQKVKSSAIYQEPTRTPFQPPKENPPQTNMAKKGQTK